MQRAPLPVAAEPKARGSGARLPPLSLTPTRAAPLQNAPGQAKEKEAVAGGKAPFYLKKSEKKRLELVAKYEALKASGGLDKYMAKRRKKNAAKDHRYLPVGRRGQAGRPGAGGGGGDE